MDSQKPVNRPLNTLLVSFEPRTQQSHCYLPHHNLISPLIDAAHSSIHQVPRCPSLKTIPARPKDLHSPIRRIKRRIRRKKLRLGNHDIRLITNSHVPSLFIRSLLQQRRLVSQIPRRFQFRAHQSNMPLDQLMLPNRLPMLNTLTSKSNSLIDTTLYDSQTTRRNTQPSTHQTRICYTQPLPDRT